MNSKIKCPFRKAYTQQKANAKRRGVLFLLTFEQWKNIWLASGKWEHRGRGANKYCMCRNNDIGAYEIGNVFVDLGKQNVSDGNKGKKNSAETKAKKSSALKGMPHPWSVGANNPMHRLEVKAKISAALSGGNHYKAKMVGTPHGIWRSATECAKALGIAIPTVNWRCKNNYLNFAYLT